MEERSGAAAGRGELAAVSTQTRGAQRSQKNLACPRSRSLAQMAGLIRFVLFSLAASAVARAFVPAHRSTPGRPVHRSDHQPTPRSPLPRTPKSKDGDGEDEDAASPVDPISVVTSSITAVLFAFVGIGLLLNINGYGYMWGPDGLEFGTLGELRMSYALEHRLPAAAAPAVP